MDKLTKYSCESPLEWHGCYNKDSKYTRYFTPESNAHPAKMSWGLADRIFKHLKQLNLLKEDSTIIDFMAGTGRTNIMATLHGHKSIAIELEPHFCKMIHDNKSQLEKVKMTDCDIEIIQADAKAMGDILRESGVGIVSPPYQDTKSTDTDGIDWFKSKYQPKRDRSSEESWGLQYSSDPKNIGNLPDKPLVGVVSPPYENISPAKNSPSIDKKKQWETYRKQGGGLSFEGFSKQQERHSAGYPSNPSNIANLPDKPLVGVVSPPYQDTRVVDRTAVREAGDKFRVIGSSVNAGYSPNPSNIGNLKDTPLVGITSPPYESGRVATYEDTMSKTGIEKWNEKDRTVSGNYSSNPDNIVNQDSYLSAMLQVYSQACKSGISPLVTVTKNPTRDGKLRRLDLDTVNLLQLAGYKIIDYHRAILFKERNQMTLDGKIKKIPKGRLSFFKRLSYQKGGKVARWEDVLFAVK